MLNIFRILVSCIKKTCVIRRKEHVNVLYLYCDMVLCCIKFHIGTNHYVDAKIWKLTPDEKTIILQNIKAQVGKNRKWQDAYMANWKFINKYSDLKYETSNRLVEKRRQAYIKQYGLPQSFTCQYGLKLIREHNGRGKIKAGENLCVARGVDIDLTGDITFGNDVNISEGAKFLTHAHDYDNILGKEIISSDMAYLTPLVVGDDVHFGARCIILPGCNHIGSHSFIGAGAVVTHDVPEWAVVAGNPAKVIKMRTPKVE